MPVLVGEQQTVADPLPVASTWEESVRISSAVRSCQNRLKRG